MLFYYKPLHVILQNYKISFKGITALSKDTLASRLERQGQITRVVQDFLTYIHVYVQYK